MSSPVSHRMGGNQPSGVMGQTLPWVPLQLHSVPSPKRERLFSTSHLRKLGLQEVRKHAHHHM